MIHRIFLTGGTGFLGSHFLAQALSAGHEVFALRRPGSTPRISLPAEPHWLEGRLDDGWAGELSACDRLVHLAAAGVDPRQCDWQQLFDVNLTQSLSLWKQAAEAGIRRFIIAGSCFEYGSSGERYDFIPADAPLEPTGPYHASKAAATLTARAFAVEKKLELLVLRPFHLFGEGEEKNRFWPALRKAALAGENFPMTSGEQVRDFIPVEYAAKIFLAALDDPALRPGQPEIRNLGTGKPQTLAQFAETWWKQWNATGRLQFGAVPYRPNEVMRYVPLLG
jgi:nucleoside-diphosphate-sugar epimerase